MSWGVFLEVGPHAEVPACGGQPLRHAGVPFCVGGENGPRFHGHRGHKPHRSPETASNLPSNGLWVPAALHGMTAKPPAGTPLDLNEILLNPIEGRTLLQEKIQFPRRRKPLRRTSTP